MINNFTITTFVFATALGLAAASYSEETVPMSPEINEGADAPNFTLIDQSGDSVTLSEFRGKPVIVYFYPKDFTPGCTREACDFRDNWTAIKERGAVILGISPDNLESHKKFAVEHNLPFPLLADPDHQVMQAYGAWGSKTNYGKQYEGVIRSTFLIDRNGKVAKVWRNVKVDGHSQQVLIALDDLGKY